jgi:5-methylcytosine-specific restriction protein A
MNWIISANAKMYDHSSSFEHFGYIDWRQGRTKYQVGDIVYIYSTRPLMMLQYKCLVEEINLTSNEIRDDKEYWLDLEEYEKSIEGNFIRLKLIEQVSNSKMKLNELKNNGLKSAPQGPMKIQNEMLLKHIEKYFTDNYQTDIFPEILNETENEGIKKTITVNKYERSSKARENAVKHHGINCKVCNVNFENAYGEIGKEFIHIHHIIPIHKIGKNYKVNYKTDLIPVCPNCHAMLHRKIEGKEPTIEELKSLINNNNA